MAISFKNWLGNLFGSSPIVNQSITLTGKEDKTTDYTNMVSTDVTIARSIYHNTNKNYALAGQLVRPIINNNVNFIGIPTLFANKKALKVFEEVNIDYRKIHKAIEVEGDLLVWPQWNDKKQEIELVLITKDTIAEVFIDPVSKEVYGYRFQETVNYNTPESSDQQVQIEHLITDKLAIQIVSGSISKVIKTTNPFGVLPVVHFSNDRDINDFYGHSEIEPIEPQLRFYHELTYEAGSAQSRDGHPKLKVTTSKPQQWIDNNFGKGTYADILEGKKSISMQDRDLFVNGEGDDVAYLYLNKTTGDYTTLAETTFTNIVEGSETPEINFGANIGTSLASVKEYRPVWIKKIEAKQYERELPWLEVYELIIMIHNFVNVANVKNDIVMAWPKPNFASVKEQSEIIEAFAKAIEKLKTKGIVTNEEVYDTLKALDIFDLNKDFAAHQKVAEDEREKESPPTKSEEGSDKDPAKTDESDPKDANNGDE